MAGKGDSDAKGGVNSGLGLGTGTWRVTGKEGLLGRHGELLRIEDDVTQTRAEEPTSLEGLQREAARALFKGVRRSRARTGTRTRSAIGSMQDLFGLRDRIGAKITTSNACGFHSKAPSEPRRRSITPLWIMSWWACDDCCVVLLHRLSLAGCG